MPRQVQHIRHTTVTADAYLGLAGEVTVDSTKNTLRVHDGAIPGGTELAKADLVNIAAATASSDGKATSTQIALLEANDVLLAAHLIDDGASHGNATGSIDGFMSAADKTKLDTVMAGATDDLTASEILALLLTVDGAGSGLDADTLDGISSAGYALAGALEAASGQQLLVPNATAPTGWAKDIDVSDKVIRVVSTSGGGIGGSWTLSGLTNGNVGNTALTLAQLPAHTHTYTRYGQLRNGISGGGSWSNGWFDSATINSGSSGSNNSHTHSGSAISSDGVWRPAYLDVIKVTKS